MMILSRVISKALLTKLKKYYMEGQFLRIVKVDVK